MKRDLNVDRAVRNGCVQQRDISLSSTLNMALPRRLLPVSVMISMNEGYVSPQNQVFKLFWVHYLKFSTPGVFLVLVPIKPANLRHLKYHISNGKDANLSAAQDRNMYMMYAKYKYWCVRWKCEDSIMEHVFMAP